jgi:MFS family permease
LALFVYFVQFVAVLVLPKQEFHLKLMALLTTHADRWGRRLVLCVGASLMILAGVVFAVTRNPLLLLLAATAGVISPSGNQVCPFLSIYRSFLSLKPPEELGNQPAKP